MFLRGAAGGLALAMGGGVYSVIIEPGFRMILPHWHIPHPHWPVDMPPLRIAVITDLHAVQPWMPPGRIEGIVEAANALGADLIVLLGDYVAALRRFRSDLVPIADWTKPLGALHAPLGVFAVLGNHDWWDDVDGVRRGLEGQGIAVLENDALKLTGGGRSFWLAGLGDQLAYPLGNRRFRGVDDLDGTLAKVPADGSPLILLAHEPDIFVRVPDRVTLTLCGHTHGGQVRVPFLGRPVVPSDFGQRYAYGHIVESGRHLIVSAGLGLSVLPVRFMVPPELPLITLGPVESGIVPAVENSLWHS